MKISWRLIGLGAVGYLIFLVSTLPADAVLPRLQTRGVLASGVSGSIWNGKVAALQIGGFSFGAVDWDVSVWHFFTGQLSVELHAKRDDGSLQATLAKGFGKRLIVRRLQGVQPMTALGSLGLPGGWDGSIQLNLSEVYLENNWPVHIRGTADAKNLSGPANQPMQIGSFRVAFSGDKEQDGLKGSLTSAGDGPFDVTGSLRLLPNRNYVIDGKVIAHPGTPKPIMDALQYLGPPDAQGAHPLSMSGRL